MLIRIASMCLAGLLVCFGVGGSLYFHLGKDASMKRKWLPWFVIPGSMIIAMILMFMETNRKGLSFPEPQWLLAIPVAGLLAWLNSMHIKFCHKCAAMNFDRTVFHPVRKCLWCGADFVAVPEYDESF